MQTPRKRTALLASIAVGAVATMGLGFALWTDQLNVDATVGTGNLNVEFAEVAADKCDPATVDRDGSTKGIEVTVEDAVPGFTCVITADIRNTGTVDAKVTAINPTGTPVAEITLRPSGIGEEDVIAKDASKAVTFTLEVGDDVAEDVPASTIGASIDFANDTP